MGGKNAQKTAFEGESGNAIPVRKGGRGGINREQLTNEPRNKAAAQFQKRQYSLGRIGHLRETGGTRACLCLKEERKRNARLMRTVAE